MPQMGVSVSEGTITRWAKQVGEPHRGRRDDRRDLDRQGRHRGPLAGDRRRPRDPGQRGRDGAGEHPDRGDRRRGDAGDPADPRRPPPTTPRRRRRTPATSQTMAAQPARRAAAGGRPERRRDDDAGRTFVSPVVARMLAEHRLDIEPDPRHRPRRPRDQEGRAGVHRLRRQAPQRRARAEVHDVPHFAPPAEEPAVVAAPQPPAAPQPAPPRPPPRLHRAAARDRRWRARAAARSSTSSTPSAR